MLILLDAGLYELPEEHINMASSKARLGTEAS